MNVFLSYSSTITEIAKRVAHLLKDEGDEVFFDRESLPVGETYDRRIREAIEDCDVFVFFVSPPAIEPGCYAMAELRIAELALSSKDLKVLPVMVTATDFDALPTSLRSVTVLQPQGDEVAEILAALAELRQSIKRERAAVSVMVTNSGWILTFHILDPHPRQIFYRFADDSEFKTTGQTQIPSLTTGFKLPRLQAATPAFSGKRDLYLKYVDARGQERGPFRLQIDPVQSVVAFTKDTLEMTRPWVGFGSSGDGTLHCAYFSHLIAYKSAFKEIRYSVDSDTLDQKLRFTVASQPAETTIDRNDQTMVEIPSAANYVCVKLFFLDGSEWPAESFHRPA